jgi:hypothetical protein
VKSDLDRLATNATRGAVTAPLTPQVEGGGFRFFRTPSSPSGGVEFEPSGAGAGVVLSSPALRIQTRDGEGLFGLEEDWQSIPSSGTVSGIEKLRHLRVRVPLDPGNYPDGSSATLTILDANNQFAGRAVVIFRSFPSEKVLEVNVYDRTNTLISGSAEAFFQQASFKHLYINLLDDQLHFTDLLGAATKPLSLVLERSGLPADYVVVFTDSDGGFGGSASGGLLVPNYSETLKSGSLSMRTGYQQLPDLTYVLEHGAVLAAQPDGAAMAIPPSLAVAATQTQVVLTLVLPGLHGSTAGLGGSRTLSLLASGTGEGAQFEARAAHVSLTIPTSHPDAWAAYLNQTLEVAGLSDAAPAPQFNITSTASAVQLDLFGPTSAPGDTTEDLVVRLQYATIDLKLRPTG